MIHPQSRRSLWHWIKFGPIRPPRTAHQRGLEKEWDDLLSWLRPIVDRQKELRNG